MEEDENFVVRDHALFNEVTTPHQRQATPQQYFNQERPSIGDMTDRNRSKIDTAQAYIENEKALKGDIDDRKDYEDEQHHFLNERAFNDAASDNSRSKIGT